MSHLNDIVGGLAEESYATCLYALYDSTTQVCSIARAGHPRPPWSIPTAVCTSPDSPPIRRSARRSRPSRPSR